MSNITAIDPSVERRFVPKADVNLPVDEQLTLIYKQPTMSQMASVTDNQILSKTKGKTTDYKYLISQADIRRVELSLVGWVNFLFPADHPKTPNEVVPFSKENITMLPADIRDEFVNNLTGRDKDDEDKDDELGEAQAE